MNIDVALWSAAPEEVDGVARDEDDRRIRTEGEAGETVSENLVIVNEMPLWEPVNVSNVEPNLLAESPEYGSLSGVFPHDRERSKQDYDGLSRKTFARCVGEGPDWQLQFHLRV